MRYTSCSGHLRGSEGTGIERHKLRKEFTEYNQTIGTIYETASESLHNGFRVYHREGGEGVRDLCVFVGSVRPVLMQLLPFWVDRGNTEDSTSTQSAPLQSPKGASQRLSRRRQNALFPGTARDEAVGTGFRRRRWIERTRTVHCGSTGRESELVRERAPRENVEKIQRTRKDSHGRAQQ